LATLLTVFHMAQERGIVVKHLWGKKGGFSSDTGVLGGAPCFLRAEKLDNPGRQGKGQTPSTCAVRGSRGMQGQLKFFCLTQHSGGEQKLFCRMFNWPCQEKRRTVVVPLRLPQKKKKKKTRGKTQTGNPKSHHT